MTDIELGSPIAWAERKLIGNKRITDGFSLVHRVLNLRVTYCLLEIAPAKDHMTPFESFGVCRRCKDLWESGASEPECRAALVAESHSFKGAA